MSDDVGGIFASDAHRRVLAILANPDQKHRNEDEVIKGVDADDYLDLDFDGAMEILDDLEADGDATKAKDGWNATKAGLDKLRGRTHD